MRKESMLLTDEEIAFDMLSTCKNMLGILNTYAIEASNDEIEEVIEDIYLNIKDAQRQFFRVMYSKGWYKLEKEETPKINKVINEFQGYRDDL